MNQCANTRTTSTSNVMRSPTPSRSFMCATLAALVIALSAIAGTDGQSSLDPQTEDVSARLSLAIEQDDAETVLRLLPGLDAAGATEALVVAASLDSHKVVAALLESSVEASAPTRYPLEKVWVVPFEGYTALHAAAEREFIASAALLLEHGADANARAEGGWTPLHMALLLGPDRPNLAVAELLLAQGADPAAATDLVGWTPLHLAALQAPSLADAVLAGDAPCCGGEGAAALALVEAMLAKGADAKARTRLGGWTPWRLATNRLRHKTKGRWERLAERDPVLGALRAAGGEDDGDDAAPLTPLPVHTAGSGGTWQGVDTSGQPGTVAPAAGSAVGRVRIAYALPSGFVFGGREMQGSFTAAGAEERLLFEIFELVDEDRHRSGRHEAAAVEDRHGVVRPIMVYDDYTKFVGTCWDPQTNTDVAMFQHSYDVGTSEDRVYLQYDDAKGAFATVVREVPVLHEQELDASLLAVDARGVCDWRGLASAQTAYEAAIAALRVGEASGLETNGEMQPLPTRAVPAAEVAMQLDKLRALPEDVIGIWEVEAESRWKVVGVEYKRLRSQPRVPASDGKDEFRTPCGGALLAWDGLRREWRSLLDCAALEEVAIHGETLTVAVGEGVGEMFLLDEQAAARGEMHTAPYYPPWKVHDGTLSAAAYSRDWPECPSRSDGRVCYLEIDLPTGAARVEAPPLGDQWIYSRRGLPERGRD